MTGQSDALPAGVGGAIPPNFHDKSTINQLDKFAFPVCAPGGGASLWDLSIAAMVVQSVGLTASMFGSAPLGGALVVAGGAIGLTSSATSLLGAAVVGSLCCAALLPIFGAYPRAQCARAQPAETSPSL